MLRCKRTKPGPCDGAGAATAAGAGAAATGACVVGAARGGGAGCAAGAGRDDAVDIGLKSEGKSSSTFISFNQHEKTADATIVIYLQQ